jgi:predicted heme/steroid binding protein
MLEHGVPLKELIEQDLRRCDGTYGSQEYVAYRGLIYDVSASVHWRAGTHHDLHSAGQDLTGKIIDVPPSASVFRKFLVIGRLMK